MPQLSTSPQSATRPVTTQTATTYTAKRGSLLRMMAASVGSGRKAWLDLPLSDSRLSHSTTRAQPKLRKLLDI